MKTALILIAAALPLMAQTGFDFKSLDKLGANSKHSTNVTLDKSMLKFASNFLGNDKDTESVRTLIRNLNGIYVRTYEFDKPGQYNEADLAPLRAYLKQPQWSRMVETKDNDDTTVIYIQPLPQDRIGGVAVITTGSKEVTVVYIEGIMNLNDVANLGGNMGIPKLNIPRELRDHPKEN